MRCSFVKIKIAHKWVTTIPCKRQVTHEVWWDHGEWTEKNLCCPVHRGIFAKRGKLGYMATSIHKYVPPRRVGKELIEHAERVGRSGLLLGSRA